MPQTLVIVAHPAMQQSRANRTLMQAARGAGSHVEVVDLYALYPDYLIDVAAEQARLAAAQLVVWQHPIQWYATPAL
ncbi:MAG TPA: NAD(P)H-dependent oxidoreductase, partial [Albitalea sp.]|nr:NAD(P)H-dependent oxidoreductase [Albitalea sp.]